MWISRKPTVNRAQMVPLFTGSARISWNRTLIPLVRKIRPAFKAIISDLAPKTTGNRWADHQKSMRLVEHTLLLAETLLHEKGNYLCKVFQGEDLPPFVSRMKERFSKVRIIKPESSRKESREIFVLGMGYKK